MNKPSLLKGLIAPLVVTILLTGLFLSLFFNFNARYEQVVKNLDNGTAVVLSPDCDTAVLSKIILSNGYAQSSGDAALIAKVLVDRQTELGRLSSLYSLQKRSLGQISADSLAGTTGGLANRLKSSCEHLGQDINLDSLPEYVKGPGDGKIIVSVVRKASEASKDMMPCSEVPVLLRSHFRDSTNQASSAIVGYLITGADGLAVFDGLDIASSYSVLPVKKGYEYGASKGTLEGKWKLDKKEGAMKFVFEEKEHRIPLFSNADLKRIKNDKSILVRSPRDYKSSLVKWFVFVMLAWWALCLFLYFLRRNINGGLIGSCMFLTGLSLLMMFSMQDPLNDELNGPVMGQGTVIGLVLCILLQCVDFVRFYQNNYKVRFDAPMSLVRWALPKRFCDKLPRGIGWALLALLLTALLWTPLGQSVGGMRVNLNLFGIKFQPSEIAKYLILLFTAAFFTQQADVIIAYSRPQRIKLIGSKVKTLLWIIVGLAVLLVMYLALGDMGPGLVIGVTFILLYSLVKSKVDLEGAGDKDRWKRIFSCDFAMLVYGVLSFAGFLVIGYYLGMMWLFGLLWFVAWIAFGYFAMRKQLFESAMLLNMVLFVFICGGQIMKGIPALEDSSVVMRFDERTSMCVNKWGDLDIENHGAFAKPVSNIQVANGLWALSTGGLKGQGMGGGRPSLIPAFHTDMILSSIGEQLGWIGLLMVVIALVVLLRRMAITGYQVGHPFAFYLCMSFAIVTGVQFFIIALGSSGMIPMTGVTVPFLSFGRVSMILNLAAFGIVLSLSSHSKAPETAVSQSVRRKSVEQYSYPIAMITLVFLVFSAFTLGVWQYYQLWERDASLLHPAYVHNKLGMPVVEYNPRIKLIEDNMYAGNIRDRKGILLATSDKEEMPMEKRNLKRYYPYGNQLFFMVGDNTDFYDFVPKDDDIRIGYFADYQHHSYLRGFDNVLYDENHNPVEVTLASDCYKESAFLAPLDEHSNTVTVRDYSPLLKYLKDGVDGQELIHHNEQVKEGAIDLHLTIDAELQVALQQQIDSFIENEDFKGKPYKDNNLIRVSAVVLDANNGDLLASANYPLPDYERLNSEKDHGYVDAYRGADWQVYTERDLGMTYQTAPGSTAKVISAMAGFMKLGKAADTTFWITKKNVVELDDNGKPLEPTGSVKMKEAIIKSSNCYFINLVNKYDLYDKMETIYKTVGVQIGKTIPYVYMVKQDTVWVSDFHSNITIIQNRATNSYKRFDNNPNKANEQMDNSEWKWAWGQTCTRKNENFDINASPLNMARVASAVVNNGVMPRTQYVLEKELRQDRADTLLKPEEDSLLKSYMIAETKNHEKDRAYVTFPNTEELVVGGKTGTAERERCYDPTHPKKTEKRNDGWYMFFIEDKNPGGGHHPLAVVVRVERLRSKEGGSKVAVRLAKELAEIIVKAPFEYVINQ